MTTDPRTPYLNLVKPIVGDEDGEDLWGDKLNANFDKIDTNAGNIADIFARIPDEAPVDGLIYGRMMATWEVVVGEAPSDDKVYGRKNAQWIVSGGAVDWFDITNKPDTFPPDLPIPVSGVDGLEDILGEISVDILDLEATKLDDAPSDGIIYGRKDAAWTEVDVVVDWSEIENIPATFPPTLPIQWNDIEGEPAFLLDAPVDGKVYGRKNAAWDPVAGAAAVNDAAPTVADDSTFWWDSDAGKLYIRYADADSKQWVEVGAGVVGPKGAQGDKGDTGLKGDKGDKGDPGTNGVNGVIPVDAPNDGKTYGRKNLDWTEVIANDPHAGTGWQIRLNPTTIDTDLTVPAGYNGMTAGPITIASGKTVTVASGSTWTVI